MAIFPIRHYTGTATTDLFALKDDWRPEPERSADRVSRPNLARVAQRRRRVADVGRRAPPVASTERVPSLLSRRFASAIAPLRRTSRHDRISHRDIPRRRSRRDCRGLDEDLLDADEERGQSMTKKRNAPILR